MERERKLSNILLSRHSLFLVIGLTISCVLIWHLSRPKLMYNGKSIGYWFDQLPCTTISFDGIHYTEVSFGDPFATTPEGVLAKTAQDAFKSLGTNAIPFLVSKLQADGTRIQNNIFQYYVKAGIPTRYFPLRIRLFDPFTAAKTITYIDDLPPELEQQMLQLTNSPDATIRLSAGYVLNVIRREKRFSSTQ